MAALLNYDSDGEFGYDFTSEDEALLIQLASTAPSPATGPRPEVTSVIDAVPSRTDSDRGHDVAALRNARNDAPRNRDGSRVSLCGPSHGAEAGLDTQPRILPTPVSLDEDVTYPDLSRALVNVEAVDEEPVPAGPANNTTDPGPFDRDDRSPLQKFRSYPRKPLTVSDLTAGSWCELQYEYTLTRLPGGRRTRTKAMREGSKVHKQLEDEVHTTVKVDIMTKEDGFGLRLWNLVQGLRTLRDTGLTRELEVWGMVDGNLVNGVIDSVSYKNPNPEFEEELSSQESQLDPEQSSLIDYFPSKGKDGETRSRRKIYLTDVKTRGTLVKPTNVVIRPAKVQLLLYHRFLSDMAAGRLDYIKVCRRYGLDVDEPFSDAFIAQIGNLHDEIFVDTSSSNPESSGPPEPDLVKYSSLRELLSLVQEEVQLTFPEGEDSLGHMLRVQYIYRIDGRPIEAYDFPVSKEILDTQLNKYMAWWRGERKARGVAIEEAFKCHSCEFAADCSWRQEMDQELAEKARQMSRARRSGRR